MKRFLLIIILFMPVLALANAIESPAIKTVNLRLPPASEKMQYTKALLTKVYQSIGYKIIWVKVSAPQELRLVNSSKLSGALARHPVIEKKFPALVKIPYQLFDFKLLKVSDRERCGYCLDEDIHSIIYTKGAHISAEYVQSLRSSMDKFAINDAQKLNEMILKRRVDSMLIMDFQLATEIAENPHIIVETIAHEFDYHYLAPKYAHLQKPLTKAFTALERNGTAAKLREKYHIEIVKKIDSIPKDVSLISGNWFDYSEVDGSGVYWDIIDKVYSERFKIEKITSIWVRAIRSFEQSNSDVLVGAYRDKMMKNVLFSSYHIDYEDPIYVFARNEEVLAHFKDQDKSLSACLDSGSALARYFSFLPKGNIIELSLEQCDKLLKLGKVDVFVEYDYNVSEETKTFPYYALVEKLPMFLAFHNTPKGRFLRDYFDKIIVELAKSNTLQKLFPDELTYQQANIRP